VAVFLAVAAAASGTTGQVDRMWDAPDAAESSGSSLNARAKSNLIRLRDARYVLVNNPQPDAARIPLALSTSTDGLAFSNVRALCAGATS
jgi:hypothetical protein